MEPEEPIRQGESAASGSEDACRTETATILFVDLVGSTALRVQLGEEAADSLRRIQDALMTKEVVARGGRVVKGGGDGIMASFSSSSDAAAAAVAIQQAVHRYSHEPFALAHLAVRVGISVGDVSWEGGDCFGLPVVEAARLESAAQPGQIFCSYLVELMTRGRGGFEFRSLEALELKGLSGPLSATELTWQPLQPTTSDEASAMLEVREFGRRLTVLLTGESMTLGSLPSNDIALEADRTVSRRHAALQRSAGAWMLRDLGSRNGTHVNGDRLLGPRRLHHGDQIRLGSTHLTFLVGHSGQPEGATDFVEEPPELTAGQRVLLEELCRPLFEGDAFTEPATDEVLSARLGLALEAVVAEQAGVADLFGVDPSDERASFLLAHEAIRRGAVRLLPRSRPVGGLGGE